MTVNIEAVKQANQIQEIIGETHPLKGERGHYARAIEHDSLVVDTQKQYYFWNSQGHSGDVINWLENTRKWDFKTAVEYLCRRAGLPLQWDGRDMEAYRVARVRQDALTVIAQFFSARLRIAPAAVEWATGRGWTAETLEQSGVGFWDGNSKELAEYLKMHQVDTKLDIVQACLKIPSGMFIYPHYVAGRVVYLSGRSIEGKRHYNLEVGLAGGKQPYFNHAYHGKAVHVVVVEGQADALTLAQFGVAAVAIVGLHKPDELIATLKGHETVYVALDNEPPDKKAAKGVARVTLQIADALGPLTRIVRWPNYLKRDEKRSSFIKDANDYLKAGGTGAECRELLGQSAIYAEFLARIAAAADPMDYTAARKRAVEMMAALPEYVFSERKKSLAQALDVSIATLGSMVKALQKDAKNNKAVVKIEETMPNGFIEGHLFEMVYDGKHENGPRTAFAVRYPDGRLSVVPVLETDNYRIMPFSPMESLVRQNIVRLPANLETYGSDVELQQRVQAFIHKYVDLPHHIERLASYYVMMTWLYDVFYVVPYLRARGNSDSGKSRFTEVIGELCMRSIFVTGSTTPSPVFRTMEKWHGLTLIMDEADLPHSETSADWVQMFNTGYKKGFSILRTAMKDGEATVEGFNAFGPKVLNMRGKFVDDATESRCLTWDATVGRGIRPDIPRYITDRDGYYAEAVAIRNQLLAFRLKNWGTVEVDYNHAALKDMPGRLVEITVSLMSITKEEDFKKSVMEFVEAMNEQAITERSVTLEAKVLEGLLRSYYLPDAKIMELTEGLREQLKLQVSHVTRQTNALINRENAEADNEGDEEDDSGSKFGRRDKKVSAGKVGRIINVLLNLKTERTKLGTRGMCVVWDNNRISALITRYGFEDLVMELAMEAEKRATKQEIKV